MIKFSKEKILLLHQVMAEATGGDVGVRDEALLESAIENIYATFDGVELYPTKEEKAARLGFSLISNHAFVDGNKRIGMYIMISLLELNGIKIDATNEEVAKLGLDVADGSANYEDILNWIKGHKIVYDQYTDSLGDQWIQSNRLFIKELGDPLHPSTIEFWVDKVCQAAGLPHRTVHSLRHTNITMQIAAGVPLVTVAGRAGHARTSTTTDIYSHFLKSSDKTAAKMLENIFEQSDENK